MVAGPLQEPSFPDRQIWDFTYSPDGFLTTQSIKGVDIVKTSESCSRHMWSVSKGLKMGATDPDMSQCLHIVGQARTNGYSMNA